MTDEPPASAADDPWVIAALMVACAKGVSEAVAKILKLRPELVNVLGPHPYWGGKVQPLHVATEWGRAAIVEMLLKAGADPNPDSTQYDGWSPVHLAIHADHQPAEHAQALQALLKQGARLDIFAASGLGDAASVQFFLEKDPSLARVVGPNAATPLHFAKTAEVASLLLSLRADPAAQDKYHRNCVQSLSFYGRTRYAAADILMTEQDRNDLHLACSFGEFANVKRIAKTHPQAVHAPDALGRLPLGIAASFGELDIMRLLLAAGADVHATDPSGACALHLAARNGYADAAWLLLEQGAALNQLDRQHQATPADWADFHGHPMLAAQLRSGRRN